MSLALLISGCVAMPAPAPVIPSWIEVDTHSAEPEADELLLWQEADAEREELEKTGLIYQDEALDRYLARVLASVVPPDLPDGLLTPTVLIFRGAVPHAQVGPRGRILVSTSLLAVVDNEAQLAAVLAHEVAHFVQRDSLRSARYAKLSQSLVDRRTLARDREFRADELAIQYLEAAGYEPREIIGMLEKLKESGDYSGFVYLRLRTHPQLHERIGEVRDKLIYQKERDGIVGTERYNEQVVDFLLIAAEVELEQNALEECLATITRHMTLAPESGRGRFLRAQHARRVQREGRRAPEVRAGYEDALAHAPNDPDIQRELGLLLLEEGEISRARALLKKYISASPDADDRKMIERLLKTPSST